MTNKKPFLLHIDVQDAYAIQDALNMAILERRHICPDENGDPGYEDIDHLERWHRVAAELGGIIEIGTADTRETLRDMRARFGKLPPQG